MGHYFLDTQYIHCRDEDPTFVSLDLDPAQLKKKNPDPDQTLIRNEEKIIFIF